MKRLIQIIFLGLSALIITSCGSAWKAQRQAEKAAERAALVQALEQSDFILDITEIIPMGFPSKHSTGEYQLRMKGNVVTTRLPFIGVSRDASYPGTDEISIVFEDEEVQVARDFSAAATKGEYIYQFRGGKSKRPWLVTISAFDSGSASIRCHDGEKQMSYFANVTIPDKDENK